MRRYEGMDDLLQGVRERLQGVKARVEESRGESPFTYAVPVSTETSDSVVGSRGVLLREAEHIREMVAGEDMMSCLSDDQRDHLLALLGQVMEELWTCEAGLQGVR